MRVSIVRLRNLVEHLNKITGSPSEYGERVDGRFKANVGHFMIGQAYGGYRLERVVNDGGAIDVISRDGYGTKRELDRFLSAFILGIEYER